MNTRKLLLALLFAVSLVIANVGLAFVDTPDIIVVQALPPGT